MDLFEEIYRNARLLRLQEAKALNSIEEIYKALKKDASGRRYIETLLNGKKNLPEWFRTLADNDNLDLIKQPLEALLSHFKNDQKGNVNYAICLLFRKSESIDKLKEILKDSMDTLVQYANNAKTQWISKLDTYNNVMTQDYNKELWKKFEKEIQDSSTKKDAAKGKKLSKEDKAILYDTLYEDANWGLYVPKSFEGDSELASHIKEFKSDGKTYNKTQWCTAADPDYFNHYSEDGTKPLYVIKYFENGVYTEAWQIAFMNKHIELMDKRDRREFDFLFKNAPMELFNKIIDKPKETESYIFPLLVKIYNDSNYGFDLDRGYSVFSELSTVSDDVKSMVGKEISLEEIIKARCFITSDSLEILIKGLVDLKNKGYSLEFINNATIALGLLSFDSLEDCVNLIKGKFSIEELKEFRESIRHYHLNYDEIKYLVELKEEGYSLKYASDVFLTLNLYNIKDLGRYLDLIKGNFSLEELKELKEFRDLIKSKRLGNDELEYLIRLKGKGYSLRYVNDVLSALGLGSTYRGELEKYLDIIEGNFSPEELKEFRESIGLYRLMQNDLLTLVKLREKGYSLKYISDARFALGFAYIGELEKCIELITGNFPLEELKEFRESIGHEDLIYNDLLILVKLREKGYSLKYLSDVYLAFDLENIEDFEKSFKILEGNFSPDAPEFGDYPFYYILDLSESLREKGIDFKEIIDILSNSNELKISNINNDDILNYIIYLNKKGISALKFFKAKSDLGWKNYNTLEEYLNLLEKGEVPDFSKIPNSIAPEQTFESTDKKILKLMAKDTRDGLIPEGLSPQTYIFYGRENIINFIKYKEMGAFDNTATISQFIEYGAQNLNDINVLKHQGRLWPTLDIEDCFQLGSQRALDISRELFSSNLPRNIKLEDYWTFRDNINFLRVYGTIKEQLVENQVDALDKKGLLSADSFYSLIMEVIRHYMKDQEYDDSIDEEGIPLDIIEDIANKIKDKYIDEKQHPEKYVYEDYDYNYDTKYYHHINPLDDIPIRDSDVDRILGNNE